MLRPLIAATLLAVLALGAACGGGDGGGGGDGDGAAATATAATTDSLEAYYQVLERHAQAFDHESSALDAEIVTDLQTAPNDDAARLIFRLYMDEGLALLTAFVDRLEDIEPYETIAEEHAEAVAAGRQLIEDLGSARESVENVTSAGDLLPLLQAPAISASSARFTESCLVLQSIADDNGIAVDLRCG